MPTVPTKDRLTMGFFKRLVTPADEEAFVDGCRELSQGNYPAALRHLQGATHLTDGAFLAGFLHLKKEQTAHAIPLLQQAARDNRRLGQYFDKYGLALTLSLPITEEVAAHVGPSLRGALLALVEAYQIAEDWDKAYECLQRLRKLEPEDVVILLSLVELLWQANYGNEETCRHIVKLTKDIDNETPIHAAILLYKARALNGLKIHTAARDILTKTLRRKKNRSEDLMLALRYERALTYESLGQPKRARSDFEKIYAEDPGFEDVEKRLSAATPRK
jgi:tetratricopeptide (TPR) repeat protein